MRLVHRRPDGVEFREPAVRRCLIPNAAPDPLLGVQGGLVPREVVQAQTRVGAEEGVHDVPLVPARAIDVEPDRIPPEPGVQLAQRVEEAGAIPTGCPDHPAPTEQRRHPAPEVEARAVLAVRGDPEALAALAPPAPEAGVQAKAGLIREGDGLGRSQALEFFLAGAGTPAPRWPGPGGSCSWPALGYRREEDYPVSCTEEFSSNSSVSSISLTKLGSPGVTAPCTMA